MADLRPNPPDSPPARRPRGAPPGNLNALKHGFYSRLFRRIDLKGPLPPATDLEAEIELLRFYIRKVVGSAKEDATLDENLRLLGALSHATANLGRLIRIQYMVAGRAPSEIDLAIGTVLEELAQEYGWNKAK